MASDAASATLTPETVPLGDGPPTREEMLVYYPAKFTWKQLKTFVNSGDLGLLKRDRKLQKRYDTWAQGIKAKYGSMANYLLNYRLQWGQHDSISILRSSLDTAPPHIVNGSATPAVTAPPDEPLDPKEAKKLPPLPPDAPPYFRSDMSPELLSITMNDWPYSVPPEVEHSLIWSRVPILPPDLPPPSESTISARLHQDGLWGFTGNESPPPSPSTLPESLGRALREEREVRKYGEEIEKFVKRRWDPREWETAWFVNPPRLQSVPELTHIHVFARRKTPMEIARAEINPQI
ncbi:hypothetical protein ONZ51_g9052 [Trametes cubensis]|uniref:Uncharacterized protein n=1 Tax=Trametes cubensis TaxID=1111947 RepID=A0AAD7TMH1_9APHY|nr:hypothetical protein ONZ51_g9052 [Trametes cubensis]